MVTMRPGALNSKGVIDEINAEFNGSGIYETPWYDGSFIETVRIASGELAGTNVTFIWNEALVSPDDGSTLIGVGGQSTNLGSNPTLYVTQSLTARAFNITLMNGTPSAAVTLTLRAV